MFDKTILISNAEDGDECEDIAMLCFGPEVVSIRKTIIPFPSLTLVNLPSLLSSIYFTNH